MSSQLKKPEESHLEKHLSSKLFQKFLQKEGEKLLKSTQDELTTRPIASNQKFFQNSTSNNLKSHLESPLKIPQNLQNTFPEESEIFTQKSRFQADPSTDTFKNFYANTQSLKFSQPLTEYEVYQRDSELKGYSDYIPQDESYIYYEVIQPPLPKPKPNLMNYFSDPLIAYSPNDHTKDLKEDLRLKEIEIKQYKNEIDQYKNDIQELEDKNEAISELERKLKNLRVDKDTIDRKARGFEEENSQLKKQIDLLKDDLSSFKHKIEDIERSYKLKIQDLEREIRAHKEKINDLERDVLRERDKNRRIKFEKNEKIRENFDDSRTEDKKKSHKQLFKSPETDYWTKRGDDGEKQDRNFKSLPEVRAKVGAGNSNAVSQALNWENVKKSEAIAELESQILGFQRERKRLEEEMNKIPEHGKKFAAARRREEIEGELAKIHSSMAYLKIEVKKLQFKEKNN